MAIVDKRQNMLAAIELPFPLRRATYKACTLSPDTTSQDYTTSSSKSTQISSGVSVVKVLYPIRQPRGPRDSAKAIGFDQARHARLNGHLNKFTFQWDSPVVSSSIMAQATPFPAFQTQGLGLSVSGDQLKTASTAWFTPSLATGPDCCLLRLFDLFQRLGV